MVRKTLRRSARSLPGLLLAGALALGAAGPVPAAAQAPDDTWRSLETEHFRVTYAPGLEDLARRAGARAERAWRELADAFVEPPEGRIELLLTDHEDVSNGFAAVTPYPRITVYARPPLEGFGLTYFDDWMELVVTHELVHVFHLDRTGPLGGVLRSVFGRVPAPWPVFPELSLPTWAVEGTATWYESFLTGAGRVDGSYHDMVLRTAVLEDAFEGVDQVSGRSPVWPAGDRPYVYGSLFFEYLTERYGEERMAEFVEAVAHQWIPYRLNSAAEDAFGVSFSEAWEAWREALAEEVGALREALGRRAPLTETEPVGSDRRRIDLHPAVRPDGGAVVYARSDGRTDTQLRLVAPDGSESRSLTRTNGVSRATWTPDGEVLFSQLEFTDPYRLRGDLWIAAPGGEVRRLTEGARLDHPAVSPDGRTILAVQDLPGTNRLVAVDPGTGRVQVVVEGRPDVFWAYPSWSPDGARIAASRWSPGARYDLVLLDPEGRVLHEVTGDRAVDIAPAWSPDGRFLLWSSDRTGIPNLFAVEVAADGAPGPVRQVTNTLTGIAYPAVDPETRWIYASVYHAEGWGLERLRWDSSTWFDPLPPAPRFAASDEPAGGLTPARVQVEDRPYRPWRTVLPHYWEPTWRSGEEVRGREVVGPSFGAFTGGEDLVGRHLWAASLRYAPEGDRLDGSAGYRWAGLGNPVLGAGFSQLWDAVGATVGRRPDGSTDTLFVVERERTLSASGTLLRRRFRSVGSLSLSAGYVWETRTLLDRNLEESRDFRLAVPTSRLSELGATLAWSNARQHAFSISPEDGVGVTVRGRTRSDRTVADSLSGELGADRSLDEGVGVLRLYKSLPLPGWARHVAAVRLAGGTAGGPGADAFHFEVGGASGRPEPLTGQGLFGGASLLFPVRGYEEGWRSGRHAWAASVEYRFPLLEVHRGAGLFGDAGNAWGPEAGVAGFDQPRVDPVASVGGEVTLTGTPFWTAVLDLRVGLAVPLVDGVGASVYVRLGNAF